MAGASFTTLSPRVRGNSCTSIQSDTLTGLSPRLREDPSMKSDAPVVPGLSRVCGGTHHIFLCTSPIPRDFSLCFFD